MFQSPDHYHLLSLRLSEVLSDIGVNERMVLMRRKMTSLDNTLLNISRRLDNKLNTVSAYIFGSRMEASTTFGLHSDLDILNIDHNDRAVQDWPEWVPGKLQWLMIQNDATYPGHCLLQLLRPDEPLPVEGIQQDHIVDSTGRVLLRHASHLERIGDGVRHGPAHFIEGHIEIDTVVALGCLSWPKEARLWLQQQNASGWPTAEMKRYAEGQGCFVVPAASRTGIYPDIEWRISTSFAEKCLMLNLNITQIRCYILMKMILKTYLEPKWNDTISSFICKNSLFHCIADSPPRAWKEQRTMQCLNQCLQSLLNCILTENCPHFIIPENNLLAGKMTVAVKQQLAEIVCSLTQNIEQSLLGIAIDDLGERLHARSGALPGRLLDSAEQMAYHVSVILVHFTAGILRRVFLSNLTKKTINTTPVDMCCILTQHLVKLIYLYSGETVAEQAAYSLCLPFLCTQLGSVLTSIDIQNSRALSHQALQWYSLGVNSDMSSSKLKLASALFCTGDLIRCQLLLSKIQRRFEHTPFLTFCYCHAGRKTCVEEVARLCYEKQENALKDNFAFCVQYLPNEVNCVPVELRYEMFRSTQDDLAYREDRDFWMDCAVVDCRTYLYFMQYKVYRELQRPEDQQEALDNLIQAINTEPNLGHRETALNLLGQLMEQENRWENALRCYMLSLHERPKNNAAKWHICRLLAQAQTEF